MNFLGHCYFSEHTSEALAGSLWPDFGRRPVSDQLSETFYRHFDRHQWIDKITDQHPLLEPLRVELRPFFRKTTPLIVDMLLDHHLARQWPSYHAVPLEQFAQSTYRLLNEDIAEAYPEKFIKTRYWMVKHDWFCSYRHIDGTIAALEGISRRIRFNNPIVEHSHRLLGLSQSFEKDMFDFIGDLREQLPIPDHHRR